MPNGDEIKAKFEGENFTINILPEKFMNLWDDSYRDFDGYNIKGLKSLISLNVSFIDLDSFVSDQIFTILDFNGIECDDANNEFFEDYYSKSCKMFWDSENSCLTISGEIKKY